MAKLRKLNLICRDVVQGNCKFIILIYTSYHRFPKYEDLNKKYATEAAGCKKKSCARKNSNKNYLLWLFSVNFMKITCISV